MPAAEPSDLLRIEVVYATPAQQDIVKLSLPSGSTVMQAIEASGVLRKHAEIDLEVNKLGIFSKLIKADAVLRDRDRIEIYRLLIADPKEIRRARAVQGKAMKKGGGDA